MSEADIQQRLDEFSRQIVISEKAGDAINRLLSINDNQKDKITDVMDDFFVHYIRSEEHDSNELEDAFYTYSGINPLVRELEIVNTPDSAHLKKLFHVEH